MYVCVAQCVCVFYGWMPVGVEVCTCMHACLYAYQYTYYTVCIYCMYTVCISVYTPGRYPCCRHVAMQLQDDVTRFVLNMKMRSSWTCCYNVLKMFNACLLRITIRWCSENIIPECYHVNISKTFYYKTSVLKMFIYFEKHEHNVIMEMLPHCFKNLWRFCPE